MMIMFPSEKKRCQDCKWYRKSPFGVESDKCDAPQNDQSANQVREEAVVARDPFCLSQREEPWPLDVLFRVCGKRGRWYTRREDDSAVR